jgi:hypothetical protein
MPQKSGLSIKTMVITSSQREKLSFWPYPLEVKLEAKMGENYGKSRKWDISLNFRQVWDIIKLKTKAFYRATLHAQLTKNSEFLPGATKSAPGPGITILLFLGFFSDNYNFSNLNFCQKIVFYKHKKINIKCKKTLFFPKKIISRFFLKNFLFTLKSFFFYDAT